MKVIVLALFKLPTEEDWKAMHAMAKNLTNIPQDVLVHAGEKPGWIVAEFPMRTMPKSKAVDVVDAVIRMQLWKREDSHIQFPLSDAERAKNARKTAKRREKRVALRLMQKKNEAEICLPISDG